MHDIASMNASALGRLLLVSLVSMGASFAWVYLIGDRCIGHAIQTRWFPPSWEEMLADTRTISGESTVIVRSPYSLSHCADFPTPLKRVIRLVSFAGLMFALGVWTARWVRVRPIYSAVIVAFIGASTTFASVAVAYRMWRYDQKILDEIVREFWILWPLVCAGASVICSLGVLYAKHRARKLAVT